MLIRCSKSGVLDIYRCVCVSVSVSVCLCVKLSLPSLSVQVLHSLSVVHAIQRQNYNHKKLKHRVSCDNGLQLFVQVPPQLPNGLNSSSVRYEVLEINMATTYTKQVVMATPTSASCVCSCPIFSLRAAISPDPSSEGEGVTSLLREVLAARSDSSLSFSLSALEA